MSEFTPTESRQLFERRRQQYRASKEQQEQQAELDDMPPADITCVKCGHANPAVHRFCRKCGTSLWKSCPGCDEERPIDEAFCAECGRNLAEHERCLVQEMQQRLAEVQQLVASHHLLDATRELRAIVAARLHPCLEELRATAAALLEQVTATSEEALERHARHREQGRQLLEDKQYDEAVHELEQIPTGLRDEQVQTLLTEAWDRSREIARLRRLIQAPTGIRLEERMLSLKQLLTLLPRDGQVAQWATQARDQLVQAARKKLKDHQYRQAVELLELVPAPLVDTHVSALSREAGELDYMRSEIELSPTVSPTTLQAAQRLVKLAPEDAAAKAKLQEMLQRVQRAREHQATTTLEWTPCPADTPLGMPVHGYDLPRRLTLATAALRQTFADQSGRLCVACGLALQAVNQAPVTVNLAAAREGGVLGVLRASLRGRPATTGWGLDLSTSGLKAVRIVLNANGQAAITHVTCIAHGIPLTHPDAASRKQDLLRETLTRFSADYEANPADRVAVSWPTAQSFVRFLSLPAAEGKKWRDMLELEKRQQIPMPLEMVAHDTFRWPLHAGAASYEPVSVLLIAARRKNVEEHMALFQSAGIDVSIVQCDAVALHNFLDYDRLTDSLPEDSEIQPGGIAALDMGVESTIFVCSFSNALWFRSLRPAGDDLVSALVHRFKLTRTVAEDVLRNPARAKRMGEVHRECCTVYEKLVTQTEACLSEFKRSISQGVVRELVVVGGAGATPGLLRYLRFRR